MKRLFPIALLAGLALGGCVYESFEEPFYVPPRPDGGLDATSDMAVVDTGVDMGVDMAPVDMGGDMAPVDMGPDMVDMADMGCVNIVDPFVNLPMGMECTMPGTEATPGECDPVRQTGCELNEKCELSLFLSMGQPQYFVSRCEPYDCEIDVGEQGDLCMGQSCAPGYKCVQNRCRRFCELGSAAGCAETEFCVGSDIARDYGTCQNTCE